MKKCLYGFSVLFLVSIMGAFTISVPVFAGTEDLSNNDNCKYAGGEVTSSGCLIRTDKDKASSKYVNVKWDWSLPSEYYSTGKCADGYKGSSVSGVLTTKCTVVNDEETKKKDAQKADIDAIIATAKKDAKFANFTDEAWKDVRKECITQTTTTKMEDCVDKKATGAVEKQEFKETQRTSSCEVEGVGWLICPAVNFLAKVTEHGYDFMKDNFLDINSRGYFGENNETYTAWKTFRDIANTVFVVMLMMIIISQITGYGISSYGVKKLLPKMIIVGIMVNVSWFISIIAVDMSNILGYQIDNLLSTLFKGDTSIDGLSASVGEILSGTISIGAGVAIAATAVAFSAGAVGLALLGGVIAIVTMIAILIARQAIIVLMVVISPIAIVMMLLPNTEKYFDRWKKIFLSMVIIFPVCALVMGGSRAASIVLTQSAGDNNLLAVIYSLVALLPMVVTPAIIKQSLNGLGSFGRMIASAGDRVNGQAKNAVKNTAAYDKFNNMGPAARLRNRIAYNREATKAENATWRKRGFAGARAKGFMDSANRKLSDGQHLSDFEMSRLTSSSSTLDKLQQEEESGSVAAVEQYALTSGKSLSKILGESLESGNSRMAGAAMTRLMQGSGSDMESAMKIIDSAERSKPDLFSGESGALMSKHIKDVINNNKKNKMVAAEKMPHILKWAASGDSMQAAREQYIEEAKASGLKPSEFAKLRPSVQSALIDNGAMTEDTARRILENKNVTQDLDEAVFKKLNNYVGNNPLVNPDDGGDDFTDDNGPDGGPSDGGPTTGGSVPIPTETGGGTTINPNPLPQPTGGTGTSSGTTVNTGTSTSTGAQGSSTSSSTGSQTTQNSPTSSRYQEVIDNAQQNGDQATAQQYQELKNLYDNDQSFKAKIDQSTVDFSKEHKILKDSGHDNSSDAINHLHEKYDNIKMMNEYKKELRTKNSQRKFGGGSGGTSGGSGYMPNRRDF